MSPLVRLTKPQRLLAMLAALALSACPPLHAQTGPSIDTALKQRLIQAVAGGDGFRDKFAAQVWLVDMDRRLRRLVADEAERLSLLPVIHAEAKRAKLSPQLVLALIEVESRFNPYAISHSGAEGLMQVMPFWLRELKLRHASLFDPRTNLRLGCTILRYYLDETRNNITLALARYNGSAGDMRYPRKVLRTLREHWQVR